MDEKGVLLGRGHACKVIIKNVRKAKKRTKAFIPQPGNRELVTVIECVSGDGNSIAPLVIFKATYHQEKWCKLDASRQGWNYAVSSKGWTDNELGLAWLKLFDKATQEHKKSPSEKRLLLLDNHGSHITPEMIIYAIENDIILVCFPPHCTHLLQPLDVGIFNLLQRAYGDELVPLVRYGGLRGIDKVQFLEIYARARLQAFTPKAIQSAFKQCGIIPLSATHVTAKLPLRPQPAPQQQSNRALELLRENRVQASPPEIALSVLVTPQTSRHVDVIVQHVNSYNLTTPTKHAILKLSNSAKKYIARDKLKSIELSKYEHFKRDKSKPENRRMLSQGRVYTEKDRQEAVQKREEEARLLAEQEAYDSWFEAYWVGVWRPELEVVN